MTFLLMNALGNKVYSTDSGLRTYDSGLPWVTLIFFAKKIRVTQGLCVSVHNVE